jgi:hypothetical protein
MADRIPMSPRSSAAAAAGGNPLKSDPQLVELMEKLEVVNSYDGFENWKSDFLGRFETFLGQAQSNKAKDAYQTFRSSRMEKVVKQVNRVQANVESGDISADRVSVKARNTMNELSTILLGAVGDVKNLAPATFADEVEHGYTKYHLGAVLVRDGFQEYERLNMCNDVMVKMKESCIEAVGDEKLLISMKRYEEELARFVALMEDLGLYKIMLKNREYDPTKRDRTFGKKEGDGSSDNDGKGASDTSPTKTTSDSPDPKNDRSLSTSSIGESRTQYDVAGSWGNAGISSPAPIGRRSVGKLNLGPDESEEKPPGEVPRTPRTGDDGISTPTGEYKRRASLQHLPPSGDPLATRKDATKPDLGGWTSGVQSTPRTAEKAKAKTKTKKSQKPPRPPASTASNSGTDDEDNMSVVSQSSSPPRGVVVGGPKTVPAALSSTRVGDIEVDGPLGAPVANLKKAEINSGGLPGFDWIGEMAPPKEDVVYTHQGYNFVGGNAKRMASYRALTFASVDDSVDPKLLGIISRCYPLIEFAVLLRPDMEGQPRYASVPWVQKLAAVANRPGAKMRLAAHLCGSLVNEVLSGDDGLLQKLPAMGFKRVQINATAINGVSTFKLERFVDSLLEVIAKNPDLEIILQKNKETQPLWEGLLAKGELPKNFSMLFDESKGLGIVPDVWEKPLKECEVGYAGGIGLGGRNATMKSFKEILKGGNGRELWLSMESSVRCCKNGKDVFDIDKCYEIIDVACEQMIMLHPSFVKAH